jgi:serine/threonine-protein phosphatase 4 regulatory subunit 1
LDQVSLELISELTALIQSNKWVFRQSFVFLCEQMIADQSLPIQVFNDHFFACLLSLQNDRVTNVRLALSRCLTRSIFGNVMFHEKQPLVSAVLDHFRNDPDLDVRRFASNACGQRSEKSIDGNPEDATMIDVSDNSSDSAMQQETTTS